MRRYFEAQPCFDPYRGAVGPETHVANFTDEAVARAPHALDLANDPQVLATVGAALGCKPTIAQMSAWWSYPCDTPPEHAELWHRDVDDYRFLKLFLYLTDVDEDSGPHCFMRGSHKVPALTEAGPRLADSLVMETFGADNLVTFSGKAGTRFIENTYGVHRGMPVRQRRRLIFQVLYGQRPMVYSPTRRMGVASGHDPWVNRLFH